MALVAEWHMLQAVIVYQPIMNIFFIYSEQAFPIESPPRRSTTTPPCAASSTSPSCDWSCRRPRSSTTLAARGTTSSTPSANSRAATSTWRMTPTPTTGTWPCSCPGSTCGLLLLRLQERNEQTLCFQFRFWYCVPQLSY